MLPGRFLIVGLIAIALLGAGLAVLPFGGGVQPTTAAPRTTAVQKHAAERERANARAAAITDPVGAIGQRFVAGFPGVTPPESFRRAIRGGRLGGVILFAANVPTVSRAKSTAELLQREARRAGRPPLLVMIDQEGGQVKRLPQLPPNRSPAALGGSGRPATYSHYEGVRTAKGLRRAGVNVNLAPVADVPARHRSFLGTRAYSRTPRIVAQAACAFAGAMQDGGVAATFKHFPGLGHAAANTDDRRVTIDATAVQLATEQAAYRRCAATPQLTMLSSAVYPRAGINEPAVLSKVAIGRLRALGFTGVTISDALDTPALAPYRRVPERAINAGTDILLYSSAARAEEARRSAVAGLRAGRIKPAGLAEGAARIGALKERVVVRP